MGSAVNRGRKGESTVCSDGQEWYRVVYSCSSFRIASKIEHRSGSLIARFSLFNCDNCKDGMSFLVNENKNYKENIFPQYKYIQLC